MGESCSKKKRLLSKTHPVKNTPRTFIQTGTQYITLVSHGRRKWWRFRWFEAPDSIHTHLFPLPMGLAYDATVDQRGRAHRSASAWHTSRVVDMDRKWCIWLCTQRFCCFVDHINSGWWDLGSFSGLGWNPGAGSLYRTKSVRCSFQRGSTFYKAVLLGWIAAFLQGDFPLSHFGCRANHCFPAF